MRGLVSRLANPRANPLRADTLAGMPLPPGGGLFFGNIEMACSSCAARREELTRAAHAALNGNASKIAPAAVFVISTIIKDVKTATEAARVRYLTAKKQ